MAAAAADDLDIVPPQLSWRAARKAIRRRRW
jgi:hypothetical protein